MSCYYISFAVLIVASLYLYHVRTVPEKFIAPMTAKIVDIDLLKQYVDYQQQRDADELAAHSQPRKHNFYNSSVKHPASYEPYGEADSDLEYAAKYGVLEAIHRFGTGVGRTKNMDV